MRIAATPGAFRSGAGVPKPVRNAAARLSIENIPRVKANVSVRDSEGVPDTAAAAAVHAEEASRGETGARFVEKETGNIVGLLTDLFKVL